LPDLENFEPSSYLSPRQRKKAHPDNPPKMSRHGEAAGIIDSVRDICPKCGEYSLYRSGKEEGCELCGYHNLPHPGTPKKKLVGMRDALKKAWKGYLNKAKDQYGNEIDLPDVPETTPNPTEYKFKDRAELTTEAISEKEKFKGYKKPMSGRGHEMLIGKYPETNLYKPGKQYKTWRSDASTRLYTDEVKRLTEEYREAGWSTKVAKRAAEDDIEKVLTECPRCGEKAYYKTEDDRETCFNCMYHNLRHGGSNPNAVLKAWEEYLSKAKDQYGNEIDLPDLPEQKPFKYPKRPTLNMPRKKRGATVSDHLKEKKRDELESEMVEIGGGDVRHWREGEIDDYISDEADYCPMCNEEYLLEDDIHGHHFCTNCGYHDVPHAGTPKNVEYYKEPGWPVYKEGMEKDWGEYQLKKISRVSILRRLARQYIGQGKSFEEAYKIIESTLKEESNINPQNLTAILEEFALEWQAETGQIKEESHEEPDEFDKKLNTLMHDLRSMGYNKEKAISVTIKELTQGGVSQEAINYVVNMIKAKYDNLTDSPKENIEPTMKKPPYNKYDMPDYWGHHLNNAQKREMPRKVSPPIENQEVLTPNVLPHRDKFYTGTESAIKVYDEKTGTPKEVEKSLDIAWEEYVSVKKFAGAMMAAGAAQQAAEEGKKMAMAPVKALGGVLSHAAAVGSQQQQPKTATQNIIGGVGNIAAGSAGLAGAAYKKWKEKESDAASNKPTAEKQETLGEQKGTYSTSMPVQQPQPMNPGNATPPSQEAINSVDVVGDQKAKEEQQMQQQNAQAMKGQQQNNNIKRIYGGQ
jgi:uncharacterized protein (DUF983 family)